MAASISPCDFMTTLPASVGGSRGLLRLNQGVGGVFAFLQIVVLVEPLAHADFAAIFWLELRKHRHRRTSRGQFDLGRSSDDGVCATPTRIWRRNRRVPMVRQEQQSAKMRIRRRLPG